MKPQEKAKSLLDDMSKQTYKYQPYAGATPITEEIGYEGGKKCALIAVNEIVEYIERINRLVERNLILPDSWIEVKNELEKL